MKQRGAATPIVVLLRDAFTAWLDDRAPTLSGALAFSTIFAIAPLIVIIMALLGHFVSDDLIQQHLINQVSHTVGHDAAVALQAMVAAARANAETTTLVGAIGWVTLAGAASGIFLTLQDALNIIWHVEVKKNEPIGAVLRERGGALVMVFVMALLLVLTFAGDAAVAVVVAHLRDDISLSSLGVALQIVSTIFSIGVAAVVFAIAFKVLPQAAVRWRDVWRGAVISGVLFIAGQWGIALFLQIAGLNKGYGAAGSLLALLMWVYVSAMFLLFGAEISKLDSLPVTARAPVVRGAVETTA